MGERETAGTEVQNSCEKKMTTRRAQGDTKWETGYRERKQRSPYKAAEQTAEDKKRTRGEQQSAVVALNYCAGAGFIRIPSPHCSLSGGIKEEDTQSGFSLRPYQQHTQRMALTAAERDSGGGGWREGGLMDMRTGEEGDERWDEREGRNKTMRGMQREL